MTVSKIQGRTSVVGLTVRAPLIFDIKNPGSV
ncbi:MAG: hypothetical protein RIS76_1692, partial [Verrucomicrobiota bacterium]